MGWCWNCIYIYVNGFRFYIRGVNKMKSILISVKPKYARLIEEGYKTEEIRKFASKGFIGWVYII